ncbi:MAG: hypothetical protein L0G94_04810 [Brachybacterium sp.]|uniref:UPF0158 family protein n=1 Tax=Brachybacterium sp. TaxID=1891286 RepID=UPI00264A3681|nr:UPF0158 family protein [Brachybacterium sp.]MDN5685992.1 hypothetical protein [Brachybacterium sp.]
MAKTWLSVTVDLLGGAGQDLWPWPGRIMAVGPSHTFEQLAEAINLAFARWDRAHLSMFTLADGRMVMDRESADELTSSSDGPLVASVDMSTAAVVRTVDLGDEFRYTVDLGDEWTHRCVVGAQKIDPVEVLGIRPAAPLPYWGWGSVPDQYGRRWAEDDGHGPVPTRPSHRHPMLQHTWPEQQQVRELDLTAVRRATRAGDPDGILDAITGVEIDDALQQVGSSLASALEHRRERAEPIVRSIHNRLTARDGPGDQELGEDLLAALRGEPLPGRPVPVDLDALAALLDGDPMLTPGGYLDLSTGETVPADLADPAEVGEDYAVDVEAEPDRWLHVDSDDSRGGWQDMAAFADRQRDRTLRDSLERAIQGRGAFRRFREVIRDEGLSVQWDVFSVDRQWGRARALLAAEGIRVSGAPCIPGR